MCAEVAKVTSLKTSGKDTPQRDSSWILDASIMVEMFNGPALLVSETSGPLLQNARADVLVAALEDETAVLSGLIRHAVETTIPSFQKLTVAATAGTRQFDVYAVPLKPPPGKESAPSPSVLLFGRESTLDNNLTKALVESRQMFKDIVGCSMDFAWETDEQGTFRYVSPRGAFGYKAHELTGRRAADLLTEIASVDNPFAVRQRIEEMPVIIVGADGSQINARISATPVLDQQGNWLGARGLCRDMDDFDRTERERGDAQTRLELQTRLTRLVKDTVTGEHLLASLADAIGETAGLPCLVFRRRDDDFTCDRACSGAFDRDTREEIARQIAKIAEGHRTRARRHYHLTVRQRVFEVVPTLRQATITGAIVVPVPEGPLPDTTLALLNDASDHLAIALEMIGYRETVRDLTRTDELTGLLTTRAFEETVSRRMAHQHRTGAPGTLMLLEVDDLDAINERFGRPCGETLLREIGEILTGRSRIGDVACRRDNNQFNLWLEGTSQNGARKKARMIINQIRDLTVGPAGQAINPSVSVGGAVNLADDAGTIDELLAEGRAALDQAKEKGRGQWIINSKEADDASGENNSDKTDGVGDV